MSPSTIMKKSQRKGGSGSRVSAFAILQMLGEVPISEGMGRGKGTGKGRG
jgi:hypothetical protein